MYLILSILLLLTASCASEPIGIGPGYGGQMKVKVSLKGDVINDIVIIEQNDSACVFDRAFSIIKERIITANTPLVDNVSGATYTSYGVKSAVAKALLKAKKDVPKITLKYTNEKPKTKIDDVQTDLVILVNRNGSRFAKERGLTRVEFAKIMLEQPGQMAYYVFDDVSKNAGPRIRAHIKKGYGLEGATLEELAKKMKVDTDVFATTIADYNKIISEDKVDSFGRTPYKRTFATKGPYYAIAVRPAMHMTRGGVVVNAAGEVTSLIDGAYMASVALARATGDSVSEFLKNNN